MKRGLEILLVVAVLAVGPIVAAQEGGQGRGGGQGAANQAPPTNLQVLPKDMARPEVVTLMRGFTGALGVQCSYCHVMEGRGGRNDMASDEKPPKAVARVMMRLVNDVNAKFAADLKDPDAKIDCGTCHRGAAKPTQFVPPPAPAGGQGGGQQPPAQ
jgi:hypothetical protein